MPTRPPTDAAHEARSSMDDVIDLYKRDVDRTLLRENLKLTVDRRFEKLMELQRLDSETLCGRDQNDDQATKRALDG